MRLVDKVIAITLAGTCVVAVGCGSSGSSGGSVEAAPPDASAEGTNDDAPYGDGGSEFDADASDALANPDGAGPGAHTGAVAVAVDASLRASSSGRPCAAVNSLVAAPNRTAVGDAIDLVASGIDPNNQSSDVTLTWAASGGAGSLSTTTGPSTTFTCASAGVEAITVTAAISGSGSSCPGAGTLAAQIACEAP